MADDFESACDRLSGAIDAVQFERIRWARTEGPMLDKLVAFAQSSIASRAEFEFGEEGSGGATRRFVLKVHGFRVIAIVITLDGQTVTVRGEAIERGRGRLSAPQPRVAEYSAIDQAWMEATLQGIFSDIE